MLLRLRVTDPKTRLNQFHDADHELVGVSVVKALLRGGFEAEPKAAIQRAMGIIKSVMKGQAVAIWNPETKLWLVVSQSLDR